MTHSPTETAAHRAPVQRLPISVPFYYGWIVVACVCSAGFVGSGMANLVMSVMLKPIAEDTGWSRTEITSALAAGSVLAAMVVPLAGRLADRYGTRVLVPGISSLVGLAFFLVASVTTLPLFLLTYVPGRALFQIAMIGVVPQTAVANWFSLRRPRAMGIVAMSLPLGGSIMAIAAQYLLEHASWREVMTMFGVLTFVLVVIPGWFLLRKQPEDFGILPDGFTPEQRAVESAKRQQRTGRSGLDDYNWTLQEAMGTPSLWLITASLTLAVLAVTSVGVHQVPYFTDQGLTPAVAAVVLSVYAMSGAVSNVLWGFLAERISERILSIWTLVLSAGAIWFLTTITEPWAAYLFAVCYGIFARGEGALINMLIAQYYGRSSFGTISGFTVPFATLAGAIGPLAAAMVFDSTGSYLRVFYAYIGTFLLAAFLMYLVKRPAPPAQRVPVQVAAVP